MDTELIVELIRILPGTMQLLFIVAVFLIFYKPISQHLIPRLNELKMPGLEASFKEVLQLASLQQANEISDQEIARVLKRAKRAASQINGAKILWLNGREYQNIPECRILSALGVSIVTAASPKDVPAMPRRHVYHCCVLDIRSEILGDRLEETQINGSSKLPPIIIYSDKPLKALKPEQFFAATHKPDQLIHYIIDAIEREKD